MQIIYHKNKLQNVHDDENLQDFHLDPDRVYVVYGITVRDGDIWYYICDEHFTYYPRWKPSYMFDVVDSTLSRYWIYSQKKLDSYVKPYPIITFPEWANNHPDFYDKLTDNESHETELFLKYKELMDIEFPNPLITEKAHLVDEQSIMCPACSNVWEHQNSVDAMVKCPSCNVVVHNPRYTR